MKIPRIQALSTQVIDQIAAGEVVERPAQMIKELVENSIDAKSTEIKVEFSNGGRQVTVTDNGVGILSEDLQNALSRYATSKISLSDDLWNLKTFGFRGEALASIASISEFRLSSKTQDCEKGMAIESHFGKIQPMYELGHAQGTVVRINKLFENVPARLKFLKSDSAEVSQIKNVLKALALAHPDVSLRVFHNQELISFWPAISSKLERVKQILEIENVYEGIFEADGIRAHSLFVDPHETAKTGKNIWIFAQNRWIQDRAIQAAVMDSYRNLIMHGEYPIAAVWVTTSPEEIDVNVHPTKSQVKFAQASSVYRVVYHSIRDVLQTAPWNKNENKNEIKSEMRNQSKEWDKTQSQPEKQNMFSMEEPVQPQPYSSPEMKVTFRNSNHVLDSSLERSRYRTKTNDGLSPFLPNQPQFEDAVKSGSSAKKWSNLQILAQAHLTYIICQDQSGVVFVDQHAAHERVLFEKMMCSWKNHSEQTNINLDIQEFLFPLVIDLSPEHNEALMKAASEIEKLGIRLESLGPQTIGIKSAPAILRESALVKAVYQAAIELVENGGSKSFEKIISDVCSTMACHSAIRAGQALSFDEMQSLLESMDEYPMSSFCPHGRNVSVRYLKPEIERDFGRIV